MWDHHVRGRDIMKATGITEGTISNIKNNKNKNFRADTLDKLCKFFNCKIGDLLEYIPD